MGHLVAQGPTIMLPSLKWTSVWQIPQYTEIKVVRDNTNNASCAEKLLRNNIQLHRCKSMIEKKYQSFAL
jgi:hypothetical protein